MKYLTKILSTCALAGLSMATLAPVAHGEPQGGGGVDPSQCSAGLVFTQLEPHPHITTNNIFQPRLVGADDDWSKESGDVHLTKGSVASDETPFVFKFSIPNDAKPGDTFFIEPTTTFYSPTVEPEIIDEKTKKPIMTAMRTNNRIHFVLTDHIKDRKDITGTISFNPSYAIGETDAQYDKTKVFTGGFKDCTGKVIAQGKVTRTPVVFEPDYMWSSWNGYWDKPVHWTARFISLPTNKDNEKITVNFHPPADSTWNADVSKQRLYIMEPSSDPKYPGTWVKAKDAVLTSNKDGSMTMTATIPKKGSWTNFVVRAIPKQSAMPFEKGYIGHLELDYHFSDNVRHDKSVRLIQPNYDGSGSSDQAKPKLSVKKTFVGFQNGHLMYNVVVSNKGEGSAKNIDVKDEMTFGGAKGTWSFMEPSVGTVKNETTWNIPVLDPEKTVTAKVKASITSGNPKDVVNTVSIPPTFPCIGEDCESVVAHGSLKVGKTLLRPASKDVHSAKYRIDAFNPSPHAITGVKIRDIIPAEIDVKSVKAIDVPKGTTYKDGLWAIGGLQGKAKLSLTLEMMPKVWDKPIVNTVKGSTDITNEAKDCKIEGSVDKDTDMCEQAKMIPLAHDVRVTKTITGKNTYHIVVENKGKGDTKPLVYEDVLKNDGKIVDATFKWLKVSQGKADGNKWNIGRVKAGEKAVADIKVTPKKPLLSTKETINEFKPVNEPCKGQTCGVAHHGMLQVNKVIDSEDGAGNIVYRLEAQNPSKDHVTHNVVVTDILDDNFDTTATKIDRVEIGDAKIVDGRVVWTIGDMKPGQKVSAKITTKVFTDKLGNKVTNTLRGSTAIHESGDKCVVEGSLDKDTDMCEAVDLLTHKPVGPQTPLAKTGVTSLGSLFIIMLAMLSVGGAGLVMRQRYHNV